MSSNMVIKVLGAEEHLREREVCWELFSYTHQLTAIDEKPGYFREWFTYPGLRQRRLQEVSSAHAALVTLPT